MTIEILLFSEQFIIDPKHVGSFFPSSNYLASKVVEEIDFNRANCIVEFGSGTGKITKKILELRKKDTMILIFERNIEFYKLLLYKFKHEHNLKIIHDTAENLERYMRKYNITHIDYIISGIPSESLPLNESTNILYLSQKNMKQDGKFVTVLRNIRKKELVTQYFHQTNIEHVLFNVPPAYVLSCELVDFKKGTSYDSI
ncbi:SAM-dependent methyltransferase [Paenibacillus sp. PK3_47]|uniref:class I SAM-dependent methyltransferase n=1 Tax=Paenibacillus sp. PK3_47 TaxID=2072642 RepID=UPI00201D4EBB|nr:rRNA adenine N-6-methyltransferase family protein [Paenibacillus sp. PK3_47]UQZ36122.1 SAM-dependent methyltransferase [Paenibacillus sp. PK3_47]